MGCAIKLTNSRTLGLLALAGVLVAVPLCAGHAARQATPNQTGSGQTKSDRGPDQAQGSSATATAPPSAASSPATNASVPNAPAQIVVPAGTHLPLILHNGISSRDARPGTQLYFETTFPVVVNDRVVIPVGSYAQGEVTEAKRAPKGKGGAEIRIHLTTLILPNGYTVKFDATPAGADTGGGEYTSKEGQVNKDRDKGADAGTVIKTTGAGAGIGAIAGGGEGAGIGAGIGAATGLAAVLMTRGPEVQLPRGTSVDITLDRPLYLDPAKVNFPEPGRATALPGPPSRPPARSFPF
jgi:type IV secretion system protein VirB10